jgi:hypothetical protein
MVYGSSSIRTIIDPRTCMFIGNGSEAVFFLNEPHGPPQLRENFGFSAKEIRHIKSRLAASFELLCGEWRRIHGEA